MGSFGILNKENYRRLTEELKIENLKSLSLALEHETYKNKPKTKNSYRQDAQNRNTSTQKHAHVYAKPKGKGQQLYAVNIDGSGHDGSSGMVIPFAHAKYFNNLGYEIPSNLTLESMDFNQLNSDEFEICMLEE